MNRDLKEKLEGLSQRDLIRWISWTVVAAALALSAAFALYLFNFSSGLSKDQAVWGQFGDFVGGTVNPILGFLTVIALALTIVLQNRQLAMSAHELQLSRTELELTRQELKRSAEAQELSEKALRAQAEAAQSSAKLAATNFLLGHYKDEIKRMQGSAYPSSDPRLTRLAEVQRREIVLTRMLDSLFTELSGENRDE